MIADNEIDNAIQNGVIAAGENKAAGVEAMKFYEVGHASQSDTGRGVDPPDLFFGENAEDAAEGIAGGDLQGGQGGGRLWPQAEFSEE